MMIRTKIWYSKCFLPCVVAIFIIIFLISFQSDIFYAATMENATPMFTSLAVAKDISKYIRPQHNTLILTPTNDCSPSEKILIVVPSSISHDIQRKAIRETWGSWTDPKSKLKYFGQLDRKKWKNIRLVFLLGLSIKSGSQNISDAILEEQRTYDDIILEDFIDSYLNLTLKSVFMLKWAMSHCSKAEYVIKVDDDMFLNVPNLQLVLSAPKLPNPLLMGHIYCEVKPIRNPFNKWYAPVSMYAGNVYPNYLAGPSYLMSGSLVQPLFKVAIVERPFHLEDVFITGICAKILGIKPVGNSGFKFFQTPLETCKLRSLVTSHDWTATELRKIWDLVQSGKKCPPLKKNFFSKRTSCR